jgi:hypothetical protein
MADDQSITLAVPFDDPVEWTPIVSPMNGLSLAPWT